MALKFKVDVSGMDEIKKKVAQACTRAEHEVAIQVASDTSPFVPARNEMLDKETRVIGNSVIYPGPYARYLYFGKLMVDAETGSAWGRKDENKVLTDKNLVFRKSVHRQAQSHWFEASKAQNLDKWVQTAKKTIANDKKK